jgi:hypothetical protein
LPKSENSHRWHSSSRIMTLVPEAPFCEDSGFKPNCGGEADEEGGSRHGEIIPPNEQQADCAYMAYLKLAFFSSSNVVISFMGGYTYNIYNIIISYQIISYQIISYHIISYHIISYQINIYTLPHHTTPRHYPILSYIKYRRWTCINFVVTYRTVHTCIHKFILWEIDKPLSTIAVLYCTLLCLLCSILLCLIPTRIPK